MSCGSPVAAFAESCPQCSAPLKPRTDNLVGTVLADKYRIEAPLGSGGMCDVYRASHSLIGKQVAVKVLKSELAADPKISQRFEQEALAASRVRHPHAIDVTDFGVDQLNRPFIVMELVEGKTIGELLRENGPFSVERTAAILRQVAGALEAAHSAGVIHRDIKPDNIMIAEYEGGDWVEVADFGVAKIQEDVNRRAALTGANFIIGTPRYMSPEQCEEKPVDARSDIYSLGVVVYEMLTGDAPFEGNSTRLLIAHSTEPPMPLSLKRPDISPAVEAIVMRALHKDPSRRPQSVLEFSREFIQAAGLAQPDEEEALASGSLPRMSVPLIEETDNDVTLVRKQQRGVEELNVLPETVTDIADEDSYDTNPEMPRSKGNSARFVAPRVTSADATDEAPPTPVPHRIAEPTSSGAKKKTAILYGSILAVAFLVGLAAFLFTRDGRAPTAPAASQPASEPAPPPNAQVAEDGVDSTPEPLTNVTQPQEEAPLPPPVEPAKLSEAQLAAIQKQVATTLDGWATSMENRDLKSHLSFYAPKVDIYYLKRGVNRDYVREDRARALAVYDDLNFQFSNVNVRVLDNRGRRAVATFDKRWDFKGQRNSSGSVREIVWLERAGGRWRITGERDWKVHYLNNE
ncbi:MAG TPA: protein kinase [Blastocatellia bacterium]|nr:protein kinase [Blastocatellia bacterium]